tara:strand:- start:288 stop:482 length:195 start_codon:yes stop_codon:yes gene_type:complete
MSEQNENTKMIVEQLENLNKILSCFLVIAIKDSSIKNLTVDEIKKVMPIVNNVSNAISENINNV